MSDQPLPSYKYSPDDELAYNRGEVLSFLRAIARRVLGKCSTSKQIKVPAYFSIVFTPLTSIDGTDEQFKLLIESEKFNKVKTAFIDTLHTHIQYLALHSRPTTPTFNQALTAANGVAGEGGVTAIGPLTYAQLLIMHVDHECMTCAESTETMYEQLMQELSLENG